MQIEVLNQNFELVYIVSAYESFIWTDRYNSPGDFELYSPAINDILTYFVRDNYVRISDSEHLMIIEDTTYESSPLDSGNHVKITGRSLESILDRRIVWGKKNVEGNMQNFVAELFNECIINPENSDRRISNFEFRRSSDSYINSIEITNQYTGDTLLDIIEGISSEYDIGWKIVLENGQFIFSFYLGTDRSYSQNSVPFVVFSPAYENVIQSTYTVTSSGLKTVVLVEGKDESSFQEEEEGTVSYSEKNPIYRSVGGGQGLSRREMYLTESGIEQDDEMSQEEYEAKLDQYGSEELKRFTLSKKFDGQYETKVMFQYGRDFYMGDIVEVADEFGNQASSKIIEFIWSNNVSNGEEAYPTFRPSETNE